MSGTKQWQLQPGRDGHSWPLTYAAWPSDRLIAGSPHSTQRFLFDGDSQRKVHPVVDYVRHAPLNFRMDSVQCTVLGFKTKSFYTVSSNGNRLILCFCRFSLLISGAFCCEVICVRCCSSLLVANLCMQVPAFDPSLVISQNTHTQFLQLYADNSDEDFQSALRQLGMFKPDDLYPNQERVSLTKLRLLLREVTGVLVLAQPVFGRKVICLCRRFWPASGQCPHELFVRWIHADPLIRLGDLQHLTRGHGVQTIAGVDSRLRSGIVDSGGRPVQVPSSSAYDTMESLKQRAYRKAQSARKRSRLSFGGRALFCSPGKSSACEPELSPSRLQFSDLSSVLPDLMSDCWSLYHGALTRLSSMGPTAKWLRSSGAGTRLAALLTHPQTPQPSKLLIQAIHQSVVAEVRRVRRSKDVAAHLLRST